MKKIIMAVAAIAMAASMFAADVSAKLELLGSLFNYTDSKTIQALGIAEGDRDWNPLMSFSVNGDVAGAKFSIHDAGNGGGTNDVKSTGYSIWFKPIEMLKITVGQYATNLNQETIGYSNTASGINNYGYTLTLAPIDGLTIDAMLVTGVSAGNFGWGYWEGGDRWFKKEDGKDAVIGEMYFKAAYGADFGTISGYANLNSDGTYTDWGNGAVKVPITHHDFGVGYNGTFDPVNIFVNAIIGMDKDFKFGIFRGEVFAAAQIESIGIKAFIVGGYAGEGITNIAQDKHGNVKSGIDKTNKPFVGAMAKVTFPVGNLGGYVSLSDGDFLVDNFSMEINPGLTGNIGGMSWDLGIKLQAQEKIKICIPLNIAMTF